MVDEIDLIAQQLPIIGGEPYEDSQGPSKIYGSGGSLTQPQFDNVARYRHQFLEGGGLSPSHQVEQLE